MKYLYYYTINKQDSLIVGKYKNLFVQALDIGRKAILVSFFGLSHSKCKLILYFLTMNAYILCLSYNVRKSKTTAKLSEKSRNKNRSNNFQWCPL